LLYLGEEIELAFQDVDLPSITAALGPSVLLLIHPLHTYMLCLAKLAFATPSNALLKLQLCQGIQDIDYVVAPINFVTHT